MPKHIVFTHSPFRFVRACLSMECFGHEPTRAHRYRKHDSLFAAKRILTRTIVFHNLRTVASPAMSCPPESCRLPVSLLYERVSDHISRVGALYVFLHFRWFLDSPTQLRAAGGRVLRPAQERGLGRATDHLPAEPGERDSGPSGRCSCTGGERLETQKGSQ